MRRSTFATLVLLLVTARSLIKSVEQSAENEIRQRIGGGEVRVQLKPSGLFGAAEGHLKRVYVYAAHFQVNGLPFTLEENYSKSGQIDEFILDLHDATLAGLPAERVYVRVPDVRYDFRVARSKKVFRLTDTGIGEAEIVVTEQGLAEYILHKYKPHVLAVRVTITPEKTVVEGRAIVLIGEFHFRAEGQLVPREGIYLDLAQPKISVEGYEAPPETARVIAQWLNPIIDGIQDLHLSDGLRVSELKLEPGRMIARGTAKVPLPMEKFLEQQRLKEGR